MNTSRYVGPIAKDLGGAHTAWIAGLGPASTLSHGVAMSLRRRADPRYTRTAAAARTAVSPEPVQ